MDDTGCGIAPEDMPHIFERFWTREARASSVGTGLGLSIVSSIVAAHGGSVHAESKPGRGSRFSFVLPLVSDANYAEERIDDALPAPNG